MTQSQILWSVTVRVRDLKQGIVQSRARGILAIIPQNVEQTRAPAPIFQSAPVSTPLGRVIASILPVWRRLATRILERCEPLTSVRILVAAFSRYAGQRRLICKIRRPQQAAGKPFSRFLRALRVRQNLARQGTDLLHYNQTLSFVPTNHAHKKTWSNEHVAHEKSVKGA